MSAKETAVRGYVIAADRQFLEPYADGQRVEAAAADQIRRHSGDRPQQMDDLEAIQAAGARWRTEYAEPLINSVTPGRPTATDPATIERGKVEFDRIRALFAVQNDHLSTVRADALRPASCGETPEPTTCWRARLAS